ncbi:MAG TPA: ABC transporter ATP-binding protein [Thermoanaerobaculia bacterium]
MTLSVTRVSKKYCHSLRRSLWYGVKDIARELAVRGGAAGLRDGEFWAVDDVSFELARGEALAVVGRNGAGKSTLLKVLYGLLKPDRGEVRVHGRSEAMIELGTGIDPLLTGRQNVRVGAALRGLSRRQAEELSERVIDFTELGEFIDVPVQAYSSGMKARLAYALAAHLQPDVLLVDEVLAVGDIAFQRKCAAHMRAYLDAGGSLLLVSHNTWHIQSLCERGILLDRGRVTFAGTAVETLNAMLEPRAGAPAASGAADGPFAIEEVRTEPREARTGEPLRITLRYRAAEGAEVLWGFSIWTPDLWVCVAGEHDMTPRTISPGEGELTCVIPRLPLVGGRYVLRAGIVDVATRQPLALYGWEGGGTVVDVRSEAGLQSNMQMTLHQLVTIDVEWW